MRGTQVFSYAKGVKAGVLFLMLAPLLAAQAPTFSRDIAPIIFNHCSACHRPGESGPFALLTYDDVKRHAKQIVTVTESRFMPPWLPQSGYGDFANANRLTPGQIKMI